MGLRSRGTAMDRGYRPSGLGGPVALACEIVGVIAPRVETPMTAAAKNTDRAIRPGADWTRIDTSYGDVGYETSDGIAKITIRRPEVRNAFRPQTLFELQDAFERARNDPEIGVIVLTGEGPDAFCSGGDQRLRGDDGYVGD